MTRLTLLTILVASFGAACTDDTTPDGTDNTPPEGSTSGTEGETFDHDNTFDPFAVIDRLAKEGPPSFTSRVHSCPKVRYRNFGGILSSLGVNVNNTTALSAGQLYRDGFNAMGGPNYANRIAENRSTTTSGMSRAFDIFAAAAPEIIAAIPTLQRCAVNGTPAVLFTPANACDATGITCLIGTPATLGHIDFCNITVKQASSVDTGKRIAVAALLAAAFTCE